LEASLIEIDYEAHPAFKEGVYKLRMVEFYNFVEANSEDYNFECTNNYAMHSNKENPDATPLFETSKIIKTNVDESFIIKFYDPNPEWLEK